MKKQRVERVIRVPGSKTVHLEAVLEPLGGGQGGCRLARVRVTGDFFLYPEEALERLEQSLEGCTNPPCIEAAFKRARQGVESLGFPWDTVKRELLSLLDSCSRDG